MTITLHLDDARLAAASITTETQAEAVCLKAFQQTLSETVTEMLLDVSE
jgi:hypothetical protein